MLKYITSKKYRVFSKKISDVQMSIWEFEFKVAKSRQIREGIRQDRDRAVETIHKIESVMKEEKDKDRLESLDKERNVMADNAKRFELQMKMVDEQIQGVPADGENPGQQGILDTIKNLVELRTMYKDHLKTI